MHLITVYIQQFYQMELKPDKVIQMSYSSLVFSSDTLSRLEPFLGLHATNSTSKTRVALQKQGAV
jgi:hypothetical protein